MNSLLDFDDELPLSAAALYLVSVALAALPWAEDPVEAGEPRPRKTSEEKVIAREYRRLFQTHQAEIARQERDEQDARDRDYDALTRGLRAIACKLVGLEYEAVEIPELPEDLFERIEREAEAKADPDDPEDVFAQRVHAQMEAMNIINRAIWDGNTHREFVTGSNRVSEHLAG